MDIGMWTNYRYVALVATPIEITTQKIARWVDYPSASKQWHSISYR